MVEVQKTPVCHQEMPPSCAEILVLFSQDHSFPFHLNLYATPWRLMVSSV